MTVLVSFLMSSTVYAMVYYYVIPTDLQSKGLSFYVSSEVDTKLVKGDVIKTIPSLKSVASIGNPLFGISSSGE